MLMLDVDTVELYTTIAEPAVSVVPLTVKGAHVPLPLTAQFA